MTKRPWITTGTVTLLCAMALTAFIDGCSDDGTGAIPSGLYSVNGEGGTSDDPGVSTQTTPPIPLPPDATVDVSRDTNKPPPPPADTGTDTGQDTGTDTAQDTGADVEAG